jgi:H+/Cl- antiporter ClcA
VGLIASLAAWAFLELVHQIQVGVFYDGAPTWWPAPILGVAGLLVALAIVRLPGNGGHIPAHGLSAGQTEPSALPGVVLAALATIGGGLVLGPEAPLIALGGGLGVLGARLVRRDGPPELAQVLGAAGTFAAVALIFDSPLLAAVLLIEATGLGGPKLPLILLPGLMAAGIGSLVSIGMGSFTGLSTSAYALGTLTVPAFPRPDVGDIGWSILLGVAVAAGGLVVMKLGRAVERVATPRPFVVLPLGGLIIGGLAIAFGQLTDHGAHEVLFSGQDDINGLVSSASTWSLGALALLIALKGLAWAISLGSYRGGPTFPAMFLGVAAGMMAAHLPGYDLTPAIAVGMGAGVASILRLPLSAVMIAVFLTGKSGAGAGPLVIVGVVAAYLTTIAGSRRAAPRA